MATYHGYAILRWLVERSWIAAPFKDDDEDFVCGHQNVIDPQTKEEMTVYKAAILHKERTGEYPEFLKGEVK